jgi:hypothetical protein
VVSGASVQVKPEAKKGDFQKPQWKVFIQKGRGVESPAGPRETNVYGPIRTCRFSFV